MPNRSPKSQPGAPATDTQPDGDAGEGFFGDGDMPEAADAGAAEPQKRNGPRGRPPPKVKLVKPVTLNDPDMLHTIVTRLNAVDLQEPLYRINSTFHNGKQDTLRAFHMGEILDVMFGNIRPDNEEKLLSPRGIIGVHDLLCYMTGGYCGKLTPEMIHMIEVCRPVLKAQFKQLTKYSQAAIDSTLAGGGKDADLVAVQPLPAGAYQPATALFIAFRNAVLPALPGWEEMKEKKDKAAANRAKKGTTSPSGMMSHEFGAQAAGEKPRRGRPPGSKNKPKAP